MSMPHAITLTGYELGEFPESPEGYRELQQAAVKHAKTFQGQSAFNVSLGAPIFVRASGVKKLTRLGSSRLKLKLVPAILDLLQHAVKAQASQASTDLKERNIVAYHYMQAHALVWNEKADVFMIIKEDDKGSFLYEKFINKNALRGIAGVAAAP